MRPAPTEVRLVFVAITIALVFHRSGIGAETISPNDIMAKWKERERLTEKVCLSWRESIFKQSAGPAAALKAAQSGVPELGRTAENYPVSLIIQGTKYRYATSAFRTGKDSVTRVPYVTAFDSKTRYTLFERTGANQGTGTIDELPSTHTADKGPLLAVNMVFRPFVSGVFSSSALPDVDGETIDIDGRRCSSVRFPHDNPLTIKRVWVDEDTLAPMRLQFERERVPIVVVNLKYRGQPEPESLTGWDYVMYSFGNALMAAATIKQVQINRSREVTDKDFVIDYPAGTHVVDKRNGQEVHKTSKGNGEFGPWIKPAPVKDL
jgi:hypothetical protein